MKNSETKHLQMKGSAAVLIRGIRTLIDQLGHTRPWSKDLKDAIWQLSERLNQLPSDDLDPYIDIMHETIVAYQVGEVSHRDLLDQIDITIEQSSIESDHA